MDKNNVKKAVIALVSIALVLLMLTQVSIQDILSTIMMVDPVFLAAGFALYALSNVIKAVRFAYLLETREYVRLINIVFIHNTANHVLPMRTGELSFIYLARDRIKTPVGIGTVTILLSRLFDSLAICVLFLLSLAISAESYLKLSVFSGVLLSLAVVIAALIIAFVIFGKSLFSLAGRVAGAYKSPRASGLVRRLEEVSVHVSKMGVKGMTIFMALSLLIWIANVAGMTLIVMSMGMGLQPAVIVSGLLLAVATGSLPIHGIGNFGTGELLWSSIFILLGAPVAAAISSAFATHILTIFFSMVCCGYAVVSDYYVFGSPKADEKEKTG